jgi:thiosulfate/3-mercaptopyruvate sulfurtransferase
MNTSEYAHPEALVNTAWIVQHLNDPKVRIIESNEDVSLYDTGHIPGAVHVDWHKDLNDQTIRDYLDPEHFAALASQIGHGRNDACIRSSKPLSRCTKLGDYGKKALYAALNWETQPANCT